jgi:hypothetical protein
MLTGVLFLFLRQVVIGPATFCLLDHRSGAEMSVFIDTVARLYNGDYEPVGSITRNFSLN